MNILKSLGLVLLSVLLLIGTGLVILSPNLRLGGGRVDIPTLVEISGGAKVLHASPSWGDEKLSGGSAAVSISALGGGVLDLSSVAAQVTKLQTENAKLKQMLKQAMEYKIPALAKAGAASAVQKAGASRPYDASEVTIDMVDFLGTMGYFAGVNYDPYVCFPTLKDSFTQAKPAELRAAVKRATEELTVELAKIKNVDPSRIQTSKLYHEQSNVPGMHYPEELPQAIKLMAKDPDFQRWREAISVVLSKYLSNTQGRLYVTCPGVPFPAEVDKLGSYCHGLPAKEIIKELGYYNAPFESIKNIVNQSLILGMCTSHVRNYRDSYADWIQKERMTPEWRRFIVTAEASDKVLLLFDMLYEREMVFTRQYWMGVITMQNPFDMYSIQDIIFTTRPDLLIETGTANGGSALMWSSIMELADMEQSKIVTMDLMPPRWEKGMNWGGMARDDPTQHKLWKKRVTFVKGDTVEPDIITKITAMASKVKSVMVTLDSGHNTHHVIKEMEAYCPLVTIGSYCIVEDTKMSRWSSSGPLEAVYDFMSRHPEFEVDRAKELMYTHHVMGYLKRVK